LGQGNFGDLWGCVCEFYIKQGMAQGVLWGWAKEQERVRLGQIKCHYA